MWLKCSKQGNVWKFDDWCETLSGHRSSFLRWKYSEKYLIQSRHQTKFFFCRKTSIFQQLLENKKDGFYVLNYVQTDTPDIDISRNVRKEFGLWVSLVHWRLCSYVQHLASILASIFPKPWDTRVSMFFPVLQSNTIKRYKIQVEVTSVQHLFRFYMEPDGISSTSISSFWLCGTKR